MTFWCPTINLNALAMSDMCWLKATSCLQTCMTIESNMSQRLWTVLLSVVWIKGSNSLPSSVSYIGESVLIWWSCLRWLPWKCGDGYHPYSGAIMQCNIFILVMFQKNFSCLLTVEIVQSSQYVHFGVWGLQCNRMLPPSWKLLAFSLSFILPHNNFFSAAQCFKVWKDILFLDV